MDAVETQIAQAIHAAARTPGVAATAYSEADRKALRDEAERLFGKAEASLAAAVQSAEAAQAANVGKPIAGLAKFFGKAAQGD